MQKIPYKTSYQDLLGSLPHEFALALQRNLDEASINLETSYLDIVDQINEICSKTLKANSFEDQEKQKLVEVILNFIAIAAAQLIAPKL